MRSCQPAPKLIEALLEIVDAGVSIEELEQCLSGLDCVDLIRSKICREFGLLQVRTLLIVSTPNTLTCSICFLSFKFSFSFEQLHQFYPNYF